MASAPWLRISSVASSSAREARLPVTHTALSHPLGHEQPPWLPHLAPLRLGLPPFVLPCSLLLEAGALVQPACRVTQTKERMRIRFVQLSSTLDYLCI